MKRMIRVTSSLEEMRLLLSLAKVNEAKKMRGKDEKCVFTKAMHKK